jgi:DNA-binding transcriptional LysR family regulator
MPMNRARGARPRITLEQLRSFVAVAAREHVTGAAAALGLSQGAVSEQVRLLERALGLRLLERAGRGIRVTEEGRAVQRLATTVLDGASAVESLAADHASGRRGRVMIGCGHMLAAHRLSAWLRGFVESNPEIDIDIALDGWRALADHLRAGSVDVALVGVDVAPEGTESLVLEETEIILAVAPSHPLARDGRATPAALARHRQLAHEPGSGTDTVARDLLGASASGGHRVVLEEGALLAALRAGLGWAAMPRSVVAAECAAGNLSILRHRGSGVVQRFCALRRAGTSGAAVGLLWSHLEEIAAAAREAAAVT